MNRRLNRRSRARRHLPPGALVMILGLIAAALGPVPEQASAAPPPAPHLSSVGRAAVLGVLPAIRHARNDRYGWSVAISGATIVVGAPGVNDYRGAAYVFARTAAGWTLQAKLTDPGGSAGDRFGYAVAISGATIIVSAPLGHSNATYVYARSAAKWHRQAQLSDSSLDVALSGSTAAIAQDIFHRHRSGKWSLQATLTDPRKSVDDLFGFAVAVSGRMLAIGTVAINKRPGRAYVYEFAHNAWRLRATLASGLHGEDGFGWSVALARLHSGVIVVVGAPRVNSFAGLTEIFAGVGRHYVRRARLTGPPPARDGLFGWAVAISGGRVVIGQPFAGKNTCGAAFEYTRQNGAWREREKLVNAGCGSYDLFGQAVAASGTTAVVGAPGLRNHSGAAYILPLL